MNAGWAIGADKQHEKSQEMDENIYNNSHPCPTSLWIFIPPRPTPQTLFRITIYFISKYFMAFAMSYRCSGNVGIGPCQEQISDNNGVFYAPRQQVFVCKDRLRSLIAHRKHESYQLWKILDLPANERSTAFILNKLYGSSAAATRPYPTYCRGGVVLQQTRGSLVTLTPQLGSLNFDAFELKSLPQFVNVDSELIILGKARMGDSILFSGFSVTLALTGETSKQQQKTTLGSLIILHFNWPGNEYSFRTTVPY